MRTGQLQQRGSAGAQPVAATVPPCLIEPLRLQAAATVPRSLIRALRLPVAATHPNMAMPRRTSRDRAATPLTPENPKPSP